MTGEQWATAVIAAINAKFTTPRAYELDSVPAVRPAQYIEVTVSRRFVDGTPRYDGSKSWKGVRITTRAVAQTVTNARLLHTKTTEALEDVFLAVGGATTTPVQFETETPIAEDDGWYSGVTSWTSSL